MKPLIGVTPDFNAGDRKEWGGREPTYFLRARYVRAIEDLGGIPIVLPLVADLGARRRLLTHIDGLLLTGSGPDLAPELYGERQRYKFRVMSQRRTTYPAPSGTAAMAHLARLYAPPTAPRVLPPAPSYRTAPAHRSPLRRWGKTIPSILSDFTPKPLRQHLQDWGLM